MSYQKIGEYAIDNKLLSISQVQPVEMRIYDFHGRTIRQKIKSFPRGMQIWMTQHEKALTL